ncbi:4-hydroxy-3-methylbut-2-enyl diphosphate reductase [bacterium]|nr:4-hydroxy-3-methylbut-2-enyl diphosphate reductase [bacterium]
MHKEITLAKHSGFCYGVKRAVETVKKLKAENPEKNIFVLGELIHNSHVIAELDAMGIKTIYEIPEHGSGICVIRSHGASPETFEKAKQAGFEVVDLTCPDVKKVQQKAIELVQNGYYLIIVGKAEHPEVMAIYANAKQYGDKISIINFPEQLASISTELKSHKKVGVVVQTTQRISTLNDVLTALTPLCKEIFVANTICPSTSLRQNEAKELAQSADLMVVVGSKKSANTTHLAEILTKITKTVHIEDDTELNSEIFKDAEKISITAGASTPEDIINNVIEKIKRKGE